MLRDPSQNEYVAVSGLTEPSKRSVAENVGNKIRDFAVVKRLAMLGLCKAIRNVLRWIAWCWEIHPSSGRPAASCRARSSSSTRGVIGNTRRAALDLPETI